MKVFASESPNGPSITRADPDKVEICIPVTWSITAIINLETLGSSTSEIDETARSFQLLAELIHLQARVLQAKQDLVPDLALARKLESDAQQLQSRLLAQFKGALLFL